MADRMTDAERDKIITSKIMACASTTGMRKLAEVMVRHTREQIIELRQRGTLTARIESEAQKE